MDGEFPQVVGERGRGSDGVGEQERDGRGTVKEGEGNKKFRHIGMYCKSDGKRRCVTEIKKIFCSILYIARGEEGANCEV